MDEGNFNKKYCFVSDKSLRFIFKGLAEDLETLRERVFLYPNPFEFKTFASVWTRLKFATIFANRYTVSEILEYTEGVLHYAKGYLFAGNLECSVFGIYVIYAVFCSQPIMNFQARPRLTLSELRELKTIYTSMEDDKFRDAKVVITRCFTEKIFQVVAAQFDAEVAYNCYYPSSEQEDQDAAKDLPFDLSVLDGFAKVSKTYAKHKNIVFGGSEAFPNPESSFLSRISDLMNEFKHGPKNPTDDDEDNYAQADPSPSSSTDIGERRYALKMRSLKEEKEEID